MRLGHIKLVQYHDLLSAVHDKSGQTQVQQQGRTEVGMRWTCHLLHRTLRRCWQSRQICEAGRAHVREEPIDQQQARPA